MRAARLPPRAPLAAPACLAMAAGVLVVALADSAARDGAASRHLLFWLGVALIVGPAALALCAGRLSRAERIWMVIAFGLSLYLAKVLYSPSRLAFSDEFVHFRSTQDDLLSGHLFSFNPLLPEAARYPGLGDLVSALVRLSGLPVSTAGLLVIGSARLVLMLALFLLVERASRSFRVAGLACLLYGANPNFLYWSAQMSYESLALPLVAFTLYLVARRATDVRSAWLSALAGISVLAVVVTHHLSSYFLAAVLVAWSAVALWRRRRGSPDAYAPLGLAALAVAAIAVWLTTVASITGQYLGSIAASTGRGVFDVITGASAARGLFSASSAEVAPTWERALGIAAVGVTLLALAYAAVLIWRRRRRRPLMLALLPLALVYPLLLPLRFIGSAAETANRSTEFLFLGLGAVLASGAFELRARRRTAGRLGAGLVAALSALVVCGGVAVSWQYSERLPQDASRRSVPYELNARAIAADRWAAANLGPDRRFATDFLDQLGIATYGRGRPLYAPKDGVSAWQVMEPPSVDAAVRRAIRRGHVEYVLVERRLSDGVPASGFYFDKGEPGAGKHKRPIAPATLAKFERTPGASLLYDNGEQQIYAVGGLG